MKDKPALDRDSQRASAARVPWSPPRVVTLPRLTELTLTTGDLGGEESGLFRI